MGGGGVVYLWGGEGGWMVLWALWALYAESKGSLAGGMFFVRGAVFFVGWADGDGVVLSWEEGRVKGGLLIVAIV